MNKHTFNWLGMVVLSLATLLVMGGCGSSSSDSQKSTVARAAISGTVTFPALGSLVGKQVAKSVAKSYATPTVELRTLSGELVATATVTASGTDFSYTFIDVDFDKDYVVKAYTATNVIKAIVDKNSLFTTTTRNVDTISTTAIIVTEQKLGAIPGTIGEKATTAAEITNAAKFSTTAIAAFNPLALESKINTAIGTVNNAPTSVDQENINLVNLVNVVAASVFNDVDPAKFIAGTVTPTSTISTTQYTLSNITSGGDTTAPIVPTEVVSTISTSITAYIPPPADSATFTSRVMDYSNSSATVQPVAVSGVEVTTDKGLKTYTDASGYYTLAGIIKNTDFYVKMSKTGYANSYSALQNIAANSNTSSRPYALWAPAKLTAWGNTTGNAVISSRVVESTNLETGYISGVVVTATDADSTVYPVIYTNATTGSLDPALTSTAANGSWMFRNVPAGRTVTVTASKSGYTFDIRTFVVVADSVSMARIIGTAAAIPPATTTALKASLLSGWYEFRGESIYNPATGSNINYYSIRRMGLDADGVTLTQTTSLYFDRALKAWVNTIPAGFPTNNSIDYTLSTSGAWVNDSNGPQGYTAVFNADGTARVTSPKSGEIIDISIKTVDLTGQPISTSGLDGAPLIATTTVYPAGAAKYDLSVTSVTGSYQLWDSYSDLTTLAAVPVAFAEGASGGRKIYVEDSSRTENFYGMFVNGSISMVNIYRNVNNGTSPTFIGTASAATSTVLGQAILEITIPATLKTQYGLSQNPIFAVNAGVVMQGAHSPIGPDTSRGGSEYNLTAINHIKANINTALAKPVVARSISKAILGW